MQSKVCMAPFHVRRKVCIAPIKVWSKFTNFAPHIEGSNADLASHMEGSHVDFAPHMEQRHSFRDHEKNVLPFLQVFKNKFSKKNNILIVYITYPTPLEKKKHILKDSIFKTGQLKCLGLRLNKISDT